MRLLGMLCNVFIGEHSSVPPELEQRVTSGECVGLLWSHDLQGAAQYYTHDCTLLEILLSTYFLAVCVFWSCPFKPGNKKQLNIYFRKMTILHILAQLTFWALQDSCVPEGSTAIWTLCQDNEAVQKDSGKSLIIKNLVLVILQPLLVVYRRNGSRPQYGFNDLRTLSWPSQN